MLMKDSKTKDDIMFISEHRKRIKEMEKEKNPKNESFIKELYRRVNTWQAL